MFGAEVLGPMPQLHSRLYSQLQPCVLELVKDPAPQPPRMVMKRSSMALSFPTKVKRPPSLRAPKLERRHTPGGNFARSELC